MTARRTQLEDLAVDAIKATLPYLKAVAPYAGELGGKELSEVYERLRGRVPAVLVSTSDSRTNLDIQPRHFIEDVDVDFYLCSGNMRSREDKLRDDASGIYQIDEDLGKLLLGRDVGIDGVGRLELVKKSKLIHAADLAIWLVQYRAPFEIQATEPDAVPLTEIAGRLFQSRAEDPGSIAPPVASASRSLPT